jgi:hypothetical protein
LVAHVSNRSRQHFKRSPSKVDITDFVSPGSIVHDAGCKSEVFELGDCATTPDDAASVTTEHENEAAEMS